MDSNAKWTIGETGYENGFAWGELSLSLTGAESAGHCFCTDVIKTGFGPGVFDLRFAVADMDGYDGGILTRDRLLFGDMEVFSQSAYIPGIPKVSLGGFASPEDGSFRLGIMLKEPAVNCTLRVRWWAERPMKSVERTSAVIAASGAETKNKTENAESSEEPETRDGLFYISNAPRKLHMGESYTFKCVYPSDVDRVIWRVLSPNGGTINEEGIYTAPMEQGIFQVAARIPETDREVSLYIMVS